MDYPADKQTLVDTAQANGADEDILHLLQQLADKTYDNPIALSRAVGDQN